MGNCLGFSSGDGASPSSIRPASSSLGSSWPNSLDRDTSNNNNSARNSVGNSIGNSRFSAATNESFADRNPNGELLEMPNLRNFTYAELKSATKNFKPETVLGEGGFGKVYKGWIDGSKNGSKTVVAIKKLNSESMQGIEEWQSEVNFLGRLYHPNLVKLLGYCWEDNEFLLVYEHMAKGSLENHLFRKAVEPLAWDRRISIALGAARGLAFLHTLENQIIYRDFKASNILLDVNYNAKLSDFGLAKLGPSAGNSHVTTRIMGTYGYAAPEYVSTGHLYIKSDVYGFGVVLLEVLTGLRAVDLNRPAGQRNLVEWAKPRISNKKRLKLVMDERIDGQYSLKAAFQAAQLILKCVVTDPKSRPSMREVVEVLEQVEAMKVKQNDSRKNSGSTSSSHNSRRSSHVGSPYHPQGSRLGSGSHQG